MFSRSTYQTYFNVSSAEMSTQYAKLWCNSAAVHPTGTRRWNDVDSTLNPRVSTLCARWSSICVRSDFMESKFCVAAPSQKTSIRYHGTVLFYECGFTGYPYLFFVQGSNLYEMFNYTFRKIRSRYVQTELTAKYTINSRYLEVQGTHWNTSRYPYFDLSDLQNWGKKDESNNHISQLNM